MVVRKPFTKEKQVNVEALIDKGAKVKTDNLTDEFSIISVRISNKMLHQIKEALENRVGITRNG